MSDSLMTRLDGTYASDQVKADAEAYLVRTGNADLLPILGLLAPPPEPALPPYFTVEQRAYCSACRCRVRPTDPVCRRKTCPTNGAVR